MARGGYLYVWMAIDRGTGAERLTPFTTTDRAYAVGELAGRARALMWTGQTMGQPVSVELRRYEQVSMVLRIDRMHGQRIDLEEERNG